MLATPDIDYLTARLHGRRSRMAEAERLDALCRVRTVPELVRVVYPAGDPNDVAMLQRGLARELARELSELLVLTRGPGGGLLEWIRVRLEIEEPIQPESWEELAARLPAGPLSDSVAEASETPARPFFEGAALERGYCRELLARAAALSAEDGAVVGPLVRQEVDLFHLRLVTRGRFVYRLAPELLRHFHVAGTELLLERFGAMLEDADVLAAAGRAVGRALDALPDEATLVEAFAWTRFYRMASRAMRRSPTGLGTVVGYVALRRVEIANLTTLSEGVRLSVPEAVIRTRMTPRRTAHV